MQKIVAPLQGSLGELLPKIAAALVILVIGWIVAVIIRAGIRKALHMLRVNERINARTGGEMDIEAGTARGIFYVVMLFVLIAFFSTLNLDIVSGPLETLLNKFIDFLPQLIAGGVLLLVAWILATIARMVTSKALAATTLDERVSQEAGMKPMSESLGNILYWLVFLIFLPAVLGALEMQGLLVPVQGMVDQVLAMLPNILAAAVIGFAGWLIARILRDLVTNVLGAVGADAAGRRVGLQGTMSLSRLVGLVVFVFVFVPVLISALNALKIESISAPATQMLSTMMDAIPNIFAAAVILAVAFFLSRFIASVITNLLGGLGFNALPGKLGLGATFAEGASPAELAGKVIVFFIMLFAVVEAAGQLGFGQLSDLVSTFIEFGAQVLLGVAIFAIGVWLANLAHKTMLRVGGDQAAAMAGIARIAVLGLVAAMGLRAMGIADDIVNIAFTLVLGAVAISIALSFGLGGRDAAGRQLEYWLSGLRRGPRGE